MTEIEKTIIKKFIDDKVLLLYGRYFDHILVVIRRENLKLVQDALNNFGKNLNFTVDTFDNVAPHYRDAEIHTVRWLKYLLQRHKYRTIHSL